MLIITVIDVDQVITCTVGLLSQLMNNNNNREEQDNIIRILSLVQLESTWIAGWLAIS